MTPTETTTILRQLNKWLLGNNDGPQLESYMIRKAIGEAMIEEAGRQVPVAWMNSRNGFITIDNKNPDYNLPLYALPGTKEK